MNILDIGIIIFILFGAVLGLKRGFTKETVKAVGFLVIIVLAFILKNPLSVIMYENLPFFKFGILKGIEVLNILLYEIIAFIIALIIFSILLKVVLLATSFFEKILNATIILGIPSKILGAIVGLFHHYILAFVILVVLSFPVFNINFIADSKLKNMIVNDTPGLSLVFDKSMSVIDDFKALKDKYDDKTISESEFNYQAIELFLKYDVLSTKSLNKLIEKGKITVFDNYQDLLNKYKGEK